MAYTSKLDNRDGWDVEIIGTTGSPTVVYRNWKGYLQLRPLDDLLPKAKVNGDTVEVTNGEKIDTYKLRDNPGVDPNHKVLYYTNGNMYNTSLIPGGKTIYQFKYDQEIDINGEKKGIIGEFYYPEYKLKGKIRNYLIGIIICAILILICLLGLCILIYETAEANLSDPNSKVSAILILASVIGGMLLLIGGFTALQYEIKYIRDLKDYSEILNWRKKQKN